MSNPLSPCSPIARAALLGGAITLTLAAAPDAARADDDPLATATAALRTSASWLSGAEDDGDTTRLDDATLAECRAAVAAGTKAGIKPTAELELGGKVYLWRNVGSLCDRLATWVQLERVRAPIGDSIALALTRSEDADLMRNLQDGARRCVADLDKAVAAGLAKDLRFIPSGRSGEVPVTIAEARAACADAVERGSKLVAAAAAKQEAEVAALRAKWVALGAKGDRVKYLMDTDNLILLGKGCGELSPKARITSPVFYQVNEDDTFWWVWKTTFKGTKLVGSKVKKYNKLTQAWRCW